MQLVNVLRNSFLAASIPVSHAGTASTSATKDSTILRSTVSCPRCPENNCYKCTLGRETTLQAKTGGLSYVRMLIGFQLPVEASRITRCIVQLAECAEPLYFPVNVTVAPATSSAWDEVTVTAENAPDSGVPFTSVAVQSHANVGPIDVTQACKQADGGGRFSIYVGTQSGLIEIWSADAGHPALLQIGHT
ncbi:uncharacterized protein MAM_08251 [Metarhizium album ARSEF 1941]|uniref:Carbohydrate-binding module family 96 domain-containing protein n=1 Tax=Metarhizium album (strain ARSEF 1941) TaxID=1081103 RepID=A0A0B2WDG0_METAS|nr:uncharacterized protein MAM_08251 [Metarhizium album ARSEF 1941]KHN93891.1 hypothetical protein MAM_08251 [Metarhizium album ARSEF 1941]